MEPEHSTCALPSVLEVATVDCRHPSCPEHLTRQGAPSGHWMVAPWQEDSAVHCTSHWKPSGHWMTASLQAFGPLHWIRQVVVWTLQVIAKPHEPSKGHDLVDP